MNKANSTMYKNPPLLEALFDIQLVPPANITLQMLEEYQKFIKEDFPVKNVISTFVTEIKFIP